MGVFIPNLLILLLRTIFDMFINFILGLFSSGDILLEMWGLLIVKIICVLFNAKSAYIQILEVLSKHNLAITSGRLTSCN